MLTPFLLPLTRCSFKTFSLSLFGDVVCLIGFFVLKGTFIAAVGQRKVQGQDIFQCLKNCHFSCTPCSKSKHFPVIRFINRIVYVWHSKQSSQFANQLYCLHVLRNKFAPQNALQWHHLSDLRYTCALSTTLSIKLLINNSHLKGFIPLILAVVVVSVLHTPSIIAALSGTLVEVTLCTFAQEKINFPRENLLEYTRGKLISCFIFPWWKGHTEENYI